MPESSIATLLPQTTQPATTPAVEGQAGQQTAVVQPIVKQEPDLITKVTQFKSQQQAKPASDIQNAPEQPEFATIKDPIAKEQAKQAVERMRRDMQADYTRKTQEVAASRQDKWTVQRVQDLLNNPEFVQSAKQVADMTQAPSNGQGVDDYSALSDKEKAKIKDLERELTTIKQVNYQALVAQTDASLKNKYTDYDPIIVDDSIAELARLRPNDIREYVYKARQHDDHVKAAYELGRQEALTLNRDKANAISPVGVQVNNSAEAPKKDVKENDLDYFQRLFSRRKEEFKK